MTVDEAEKLANLALEAGGMSTNDGARRDLARFVLAVLPVVRAAMTRNACIFPGCELQDAIDTLRAAMEGK